MRDDDGHQKCIQSLSNEEQFTKCEEICKLEQIRPLSTPKLRQGMDETRNRIQHELIWAMIKCNTIKLVVSKGKEGRWLSSYYCTEAEARCM